MDACCKQAICVICWLNSVLLSNAKTIPLWVVGIVSGFSTYKEASTSFHVVQTGNRISLNYTGINIFVSHHFTFCPFRINVVIVPIYICLPNLGKSEGSLSEGTAFLLAYPVPLWRLPGACLLFHLCFRNICLFIVPPSCPSHLHLPPLCREAGDCFTYSLASAWL